MSDLRFEIANGTADGVNQTFYTSLNYIAESVQVFYNGQLLRPDSAGGFSLTPPKFIVLTFAPRDGDVIQVCYRPA